MHANIQLPSKHQVQSTTTCHAKLSQISNGNRTEWSPIRSVWYCTSDKYIERYCTSDRRDLFITSMITDRIRRHEVLLPINHKNYHFREKNSQVIKERENVH